MTHIITTRAPYYRSPADGFRDYIPEGTSVEIVGSSTINNVVWLQVSGQDVNPWRGKWFINTFAKELNAPEPPGNQEGAMIVLTEIDGSQRFFKEIFDVSS